MIVPVITCMGRLSHLRQTLPGVVEEFGRAVLVDWSCPEGSGRWARSAFDRTVDVVQIARQPHFHKTRALNAGAKRAATLGARWLLFLDADTMIAPGVRSACERCASSGGFAVADRIWPGPSTLPGLTGVLLVSQADFVRVGGYDESFRDYGVEDTEMRCRLRLLGRLRAHDLPHHLFMTIEHDDRTRSRFYFEPNLHVSVPRNFSRLRQRIRAWTGREMESVGEIQDLLFREAPRHLRERAKRQSAARAQAATANAGSPSWVNRPPAEGAHPCSWRFVSGRLIPRTLPTPRSPESRLRALGATMARPKRPDGR